MTRTPSRRAALLAALLSCLLLPAAFLAQTTGPKALVVCPPSDRAGCDRIAEQLALTTDGATPVFPGGVDKLYTELRTIPYSQLRSYAVVFVPSLANAPYDLLREDAVRTRLQQVLRGRVAVWSGTPDRGSTTGASAGKLTLVRNLARWAAGQYATDGSTGLVVLQDVSDKRPDGSSPRYDWVQGIAGVVVQPDLATKTYAQVERNAANPAATPIVGSLAYDNMASFGLQLPQPVTEIGAWGRSVQGKKTTRGQIVLGTAVRSPAACQVVGSAGGTFSFQSGKVVLDFPSGALAEDWCISVANANATQNGYVANTAYSFGPSGLAFSPPVSLTISYAESDIPGGAGNEPKLAIYEFRAGSWTEVPGSVVDAAANTVTNPNIDHFSQYAVFNNGTDTGGGGGGGGGKPVGSVTVEPATATVASGGTQLLTATVQDRKGNPLSGRTVAWSTSAGSLSSSSGTTDDQGRATTTLTAPTTPGAVTVTAESDGKTGTATVTVNAGPAAKLVYVSGDGGTGVAGSSRTIEAKVTDASDNPVSGHTVNWEVTAGGGSVGSASSQTDAGGVASITWTFGATVGPQSATAGASGPGGALAGSPLTYSATAIAGDAAKLAVTTQPSAAAQAGAALSTQPVVQIQDANGNPVGQAGVAVAAALGSGTGTLGGTATATTDANGQASFADVSICGALGDYTLAFTAESLASATSQTIALSAGAAANLAIHAGDGQTAAAGTAVATAPAVRVTDACGNPVEGVSVTFTAASGGGGVAGSPAATGADGVAAVGSWTLGASVGENTLDASASGLTTVTFTATGTAGAAASVAIHAGDGQTATVGTAVAAAPAVVVTDANGNPVEGVEVTFAASGDGSVGGSPATTGSDGVATLGSWTLATTAGANTLTATAGALSAQFSATGTAGAPANMAKTAGDGQEAPAGSPVPIAPQVTVTDQHGNPVAGVSVSFAPSGDGSVTASPANTDAAGVATVGSWTLGSTIGDYTLTASAAGVADVVFTATATVGAAANLAKSAGDAASVAVGAEHVLEAKVTDSNGVPVPGHTVSWSTASGTLGAATSVTNASGIASVTWTVGTTAGPQTAEASAVGTDGVTPLTGSPQTFTITATPAAASQLAITTQPSASVQAGVAFPQQPVVQVQDQYGNAVAQAGTSVSVAIASGAGDLDGTATVLTDAGGQAAFTGLSIGGAVGDRTLSFSASGLTGATSNTVVVGAGPAATITVSPSAPTEVPAGNTVAVSGVVADGFGNPVTGAAVAWTSTNGGSFTPASSTSTDATGTATVTFTTGTTAGTVHVVTGTVNGTVTGSTGTITTQGPPVAADDTDPTVTGGTSSPGSTVYHLSFNTASNGSIDVLDNDELGYPPAPTRTFGNVQLNGGAAIGGAVTANAFGGAAVSLGGGGTLQLTAEGLVNLTPPTGFTGLITFDYRLENVIGSDDATVTVAVGARPVANADTYPNALVGNVSINTATGSPFSVLTGDAGDALTIAFVPASATNGEAALNADGTFTFNPATGFRSGNASFQYTVANGFGTSPAATVTIPVGSQVIWFVNGNAGACAADCTGRLSHPFTTLAAFNAVNNGTGTNPADNHHVFLYESATDYTGPVQLRAGQRLIGQDASSELVTLAGVTLPQHSPALPAMASGNGTFTRIVNGAGNGVVLGSDNRLHGLRFGNASGTALSGSGFGTLVVGDVAINTSGQALGLTNGTISGSFADVSSSGGASNVSLSGVNSTAVVGLGGGALSGATGAAVAINGGTVSLTYTGSISQTNSAALLAVSGGHNGTLTFSTGLLSATGGTGLQFNDADGTYNLNGTNTLNGGDAGIDIVNGSGGSFSFSAASSITNPSGIAFNVNGGAGPVSYAGTISKNSAGNVISIQGRTGGTLTLSGNVSATGSSSGILLQNNSGGSVEFSGGAKTLTTGSSPGVSLAANNGATVSFTGGGLAITTTTGSGFGATGGGTVQVTGANNTIASTGGIALNVAGTNIGAGGLVFRTINATGGSSGIVLNGTGTAGGLTVTGTGTTAGSGGTIQNMTGNGVHLVGTRSATLQYMNITNNNANGVFGDELTDFTLLGASVTNNDADHPAGTNESGLFFNELYGTNTIRSSTVSGTRGDNIRWETLGGAQGTLRVVKSTLGPNPVGTGANGFAVFAIGNASVTAVVDSSTVSGNQTAGFLTSFDNTATYNVAVRHTQFTGNNIGIDHGIGGGNGTFTFTNNTLLNHRSNAINIISSAVSTGSTNANGTVSNNVVGDGTGQSGSDTGSGIGVSIRGGADVAMTIANNHVRNTELRPILAEAEGTGRVDFTITSNTAGPPVDPFNGSIPGIFVSAEDNRTLCLNMTGNTSTGLNEAGYRVRQADAAVFQLQGFAGTGTVPGQVVAYIQNNNTGTASVQSGGTGTVVNYSSGTCNTTAF